MLKAPRRLCSVVDVYGLRVRALSLSRSRPWLGHSRDLFSDSVRYKVERPVVIYAMVGVTRDRLLDNGLQILSVSGVSGVTLGVHATKSALSKSRLYAHFRSKTHLQLDLLDRMAAVAHEHVVVPALSVADGLPRLRALVEHWLGWSTRAGLQGGCPVAAALFELDDLDGEVRDHAVMMEGRWRGVLQTLVRRAIELGHWRRDTDVAQVVWELCGIYLTHHASIRFIRDPAADNRARNALDALFERFVAPSERPSS